MMLSSFFIIEFSDEANILWDSRTLVSYSRLFS